VSLTGRPLIGLRRELAQPAAHWSVPGGEPGASSQHWRSGFSVAHTVPRLMLAGGVVVRVTIINDASIKREACNLVERTRTYSSELKSRETRNRGVEHAVLDGWQHSDPHAHFEKLVSRWQPLGL